MSNKSYEELLGIVTRAAATWFNKEEVSAFTELLARRDEEAAKLKQQLASLKEAELLPSRSAQELSE
jgi:hypothetical protein